MVGDARLAEEVQIKRCIRAHAAKSKVNGITLEIELSSLFAAIAVACADILGVAQRAAGGVVVRDARAGLRINGERRVAADIEGGLHRLDYPDGVGAVKAERTVDGACLRRFLRLHERQRERGGQQRTT